MELARDQKSINQDTTHLASKQEQDDFTPRISNKNQSRSMSSCSSSLSSSSLSSFSSVEKEFKPENSNVDQHSDNEPPRLSTTRPATEQWPQTQVMERSNENATSPNPKTLSYKIPSHVFARTASTAPVEWSTLSNESLFSIHTGNMSFTGDYFKSGELGFPQPPLSPSPLENNKGGAGAAAAAVSSTSNVATATIPLLTSNKDADSDNKAVGVLSKPEQKAAPSIREVIQANEAANNNNAPKMDRTVSRRSDDFSVKSFAFPILGNVDKSESLQTSNHGKQRKPSQPETPKISFEAQADEEPRREDGQKPQTPKAEPQRSTSRKNGWLSCFPCCAMPCV